MRSKEKVEQTNLRKNKFRQIRQVVRLVWVLGGLIFMAWLFLSFQAKDVDPTIFTNSASITVHQTDEMFIFDPTASTEKAALIFYPRAMVDPEAYGPLLRAIAQAGYPVYLVYLPYRLAPTQADVGKVFARTLAIIEDRQSVDAWIVSGHSKGGGLAAKFTHAHPELVDGLLQIATTLPKEAEFDLSNFEKPTTKIYATHDGLATEQEIRQNSSLLPASTEYIGIEGGNHAHFGYYGEQLGDNSATISRQEQQAQTEEAVLKFLNGFQ